MKSVPVFLLAFHSLVFSKTFSVVTNHETLKTTFVLFSVTVALGCRPRRNQLQSTDKTFNFFSHQKYCPWTVSGFCGYGYDSFSLHFRPFQETWVNDQKRHFASSQRCVLQAAWRIISPSFQHQLMLLLIFLLSPVYLVHTASAY